MEILARPIAVVLSSTSASESKNCNLAWVFIVTLLTVSLHIGVLICLTRAASRHSRSQRYTDFVRFSQIFMSMSCFLQNASAYWLGKSENPSLQRVYGISFPDKKQLEEYKEHMRLAEERDHRKLGQVTLTLTAT